MGTIQSRGYGPAPKFISVSDEDMKRMISQSLEERKRQMGLLQTGMMLLESEIVKETVKCIMPQYAIVVNMVSILIRFLDGTESLQEQLLDQKIDRAQLKNEMCKFQSNINALGSRIDRIKNVNIPIKDRKHEIVPTFNDCEKILCDFHNKNYIFYQHPLITAPCLITFAQLYLSMIPVGVLLFPTYKDHTEREKQRLNEVLEAYKENTIRDRLKMIKIISEANKAPDVKTIKNGVVDAYKKDNFKEGIEMIKKMPMNNVIHVVDIVVDDFGYPNDGKKQNKWHHWDRTLWDQRQGTKHNHSYTLVVRTAYVEFFNDVIDLIEFK